jgi:hypothetical protein
MTGNLLLFARDPGNANQIVALAELIRAHVAGLTIDALSPVSAKLVAELAAGRKFNQLLFAGRDTASHVLEAAGISTTESITDTALQDPTNMLRDHQVETLVTGLSDRDDRTPQALWRAAASCGATSVVIVDDSTISLRHARRDLNDRFRDSEGIQVFPDMLCVVDEESRQAVTAAGMPKDLTIVIGNLHLQRFRRLAQEIDEHQIIALRSKWGTTEESKVVLYASEPITQMRKHGKTRNHDELSLLGELIDRVQNNRLTDNIICDANTIVVIRPHPRDESTKFEPYLFDQGPRTIVSRAGSSAEAVLAADTVVGITSMLLVEAAALGRPSFSLIDFDPHAAARSA